jgi:hypothetical protein
VAIIDSTSGLRLLVAKHGAPPPQRVAPTGKGTKLPQMRIDFLVNTFRRRRAVSYRQLMSSAYAGAMAGILNWWDGVELWLSGLGFVVQTIVVMPVVVALAYGIAIVLDGALGQGIPMLNRVRHGTDSPVAPLQPAGADSPVAPLQPAGADSPVAPLQPSGADSPVAPFQPSGDPIGR